jgi:thioredoxin-related protein
VFIHTDWCKYCQAMKNSTFKNKEVIKNLNENFYFVTLNAEEKRSITFNAKEFTFKTNGNTSGIHELAYELATINNQTTYPTVCVLNAQNEIIFQQSNYLPAKDFLILLEKLKE